MAIKLKWNGDALLKFSEEALMAGLIAAAAEHQSISRKKVSIQNQPVKKKRVRDTSSRGGGKKGSQYTSHPNSSQPGESVRRRHGHGMAGIVRGSSRKRLAARVGYRRNVRYMMFHELGIRYANKGLQKRPTLVPALVDNLDRLSTIAVRAAKRVRARGGRK